MVRNFSVLAALHSARESLVDFYDPGMSTEQASRLLGTPVQRLQTINRRSLAALYMIFSNAMRAKEYLTASTRDIIGEDRILIHGAKGSGSYIVAAPGIGRQFENAASINPARFVSGSTYRQLYAACVRIGLGDRVQSRENHARTHAARYRLAAELTKESTRDVADCLRHRSQKSTLHYLAR